MESHQDYSRRWKDSGDWRKEAIAKAISRQNNEILLILGKGDEDYQEINGVKYPFSDQEVVKEILSKKG